jgi:hypothetical protein
MSDDPLARLQQWYADQCDGDWEHREGIEIGTLDNPGWSVRISLGGTELAGRPFEQLRADRTKDDWLQAWIETGTWNAACGPLSLGEAVDTFLAWAAPP